MAPKSKITCFGCQASYRLDLDKLPPGVNELKCLKCGAMMPILDRVLPSKEPVPDAQETASPEDAPQKAAKEQKPAGGWDQVAGDPDEDDEPEEGESWLAIYGDMMSILMIFFVLMFAMSSIDKGKFKTAMESISQALGGNYQYQIPPADMAPQTPNAIKQLQQNIQGDEEALLAVRAQLKKLISRSGMGQNFAVKNEPKGLVLIGQDVAMFDSGKAQVKPSVRGFLQKVGGLLSGSNRKVVVEGHTDNVPINTPQFPSNWELSVMRAANVVRFLIKSAHLDPKRISAAGYSYFRPRHPFDSPDNAKNRRIEIVILRKVDKTLMRRIYRIQTSGPPTGKKVRGIIE